MRTEAFSNAIIYRTDSKLPKNLIDEMREYCMDLEYQPSLTAGAKRKENVRTSMNYWLPWDHWIAGILHNMFISANNAYFGYDLDHFETGIQVTSYTDNQRYDWHVDGMPPTPEGTERKLSISFLLTPESEYKGGNFEMSYSPRSTSIKTFRPDAGHALIFPSWIPHRVTPVTEGRRISLVAWMQGPKFK